ncbi:unnamed protein product [Prorocentrum cordatum]|uniref:Uncharacterized protein n=1 Tax=Prorocentrum cordatum TaxID=2364126 RepID=A0ABN9T313_9DINO|nr:unnamed protein product [Polarella glacialis]
MLQLRTTPRECGLLWRAAASPHRRVRFWHAAGGAGSGPHSARWGGRSGREGRRGEDARWAGRRIGERCAHWQQLGHVLVRHHACSLLEGAEQAENDDREGSRRKTSCWAEAGPMPSGQPEESLASSRTGQPPAQLCPLARRAHRHVSGTRKESDWCACGCIALFARLGGGGMVWLGVTASQGGQRRGGHTARGPRRSGGQLGPGTAGGRRRGWPCRARCWPPRCGPRGPRRWS